MKLTSPGLVSLIFILISGTVVATSITYLEKISTIYFPMLFGLITLVLAILQFLRDSFPGLANALAFIDLDKIAKESEKTGLERQNEGGDIKRREEPADSKKTLRLFLCLLVFVVLVHYVNYLILVPVFTLFLLKIEGQMNWGMVVAICAGIEVAIYFLFYLFLGVTFGQFPLV